MTDLPPDERVHECGKSMVESMFGNRAWPPNWRSQPIWLCVSCSMWEPHEDWRDELPADSERRWDAANRKWVRVDDLR